MVTHDTFGLDIILKFWGSNFFNNSCFKLTCQNAFCQFFRIFSGFSFEQMMCFKPSPKLQETKQPTSHLN